MKIHILTLFPEMVLPALEVSILGRAAKSGAVDFNVIDIRQYSVDKHRRADDSPFGGGAGMILTVQPVFSALKSLKAEEKKCIYMSARGRMLDKELLCGLAALGEAGKELVILCGHYEGVDERILDAWDMEEVSIGDYILTGGEPAAIVLADALVRLLPGVIGNRESHSEESIYSGLLEYPQYTKPRSYEGYDVPEVLFGGNHEEIRLWQWEKALRLTKERRPDLFGSYLKSCEERKLSKREKKILSDVLSEVGGSK